MLLHRPDSRIDQDIKHIHDDVDDDEVCEILGSTLSNIACVVNPEIIVIGGGVSKAGDILLDNIKKHFVETAFMACRDTKFALAGLGNDAGMYGCVEMLLD